MDVIVVEVLYPLTLSLCRGLTETDFEKVAEFFDRGVAIAEQVRQQTGVTAKIKDFKAVLEKGPEAFPALVALKKDVTEFARSFPTVGF